jgi:hypothetical protein
MPLSSRGNQGIGMKGHFACKYYTPVGKRQRKSESLTSWGSLHLLIRRHCLGSYTSIIRLSGTGAARERKTAGSLPAG